MNQTRIVTRPDFDGVVCAVLLKEIFGPQTPVLWTQPNAIQKGVFLTEPFDVVANLPLNGPCKLWFDHHVSNATERPYQGLFRVAPSAARVVAEYFKGQLPDRFEELVRQADKIDAAQLSLSEILKPQDHPFILLSMCVAYCDSSDSQFCDHLVCLLQSLPVSEILNNPMVQRISENVVATNRRYEIALKAHTVMRQSVSITDFRGMHPAPDGNRFLVYSLFPEAMVNVKVFDEPSHTVIKLGHSILNRACRVNVGCLLARYGGGGHRGAGACRLEPHNANRCLDEIIQTLIRNVDLEGDQSSCATM